MSIINPYIKVNSGGIPRLEAMSVDSSSGLVYTFRSHRFLNMPYVGLLIFKLPTVSTTLTAGSVYFTTNGGNKVQVYDNYGEALSGTSTTITKGGVFLGWYSDGELLILTGLSATS